MLNQIIDRWFKFPAIIRPTIWRVLHNALALDERDGTSELTILNYGYIDISEVPWELELLPEDEPQRYRINLYHKTATQVDLEDKDVLEVGSGRGGGASYVSRYLSPRSYTGVDLSKTVVHFCNRHYASVKNLKFVKGESGSLPVPDSSYDAVINIESSRGYPSMERFLDEVTRILRPGGHLLLSDMRRPHNIPKLISQFETAGLAVKNKVDITENVVRGIELDSPNRQDLINRKVPFFLRSACNEFAANVGSIRYSQLASGQVQYWTFCLEAG